MVGVRPYYLYANAYWSYPRNQSLQRVQRLRQPPCGGVLDAAAPMVVMERLSAIELHFQLTKNRSPS